MKKQAIFLFCILFLSAIILPIAIAQKKIEVSIIPLNKEIFASGENITFKVSLLDSNNNPIKDDVSVTIQDAAEIKKIKKIVPSNKLIEVDLGEDEINGYWKIIAEYPGAKPGKTLFVIKENEEAKFRLQEDKLIVTNIGNTEYSKTIQIIIGDTTSTKKVNLGIGEQTSFRLIAPDGTYNIKITDGKTTITQNNVALTGRVVGILNEDMEKPGSGLTGGIRPGTENKDDTFYYLKRSKLVYVFILVVIGAAILIAIERNYRKYKKSR